MTSASAVVTTVPAPATAGVGGGDVAGVVEDVDLAPVESPPTGPGIPGPSEEEEALEEFEKEVEDLKPVVAPAADGAYYNKDVRPAQNPPNSVLKCPLK